MLLANGVANMNLNMYGSSHGAAANERELTEEEKKIQQMGDIGQGNRLTDKKRAAAEKNRGVR